MIVSLRYQDDGEMYDEFGNLKKKFRAKSQQMEAGQIIPGAGRAGWEFEELGTCRLTNTVLLSLKKSMIILCAIDYVFTSLANLHFQV